MSAIHKRLHYSQKVEFQLLAKVFNEYLPPYPYNTGSGPAEVKQTDFDGRVDVIPVSDPNIFSQSQRITMAQELMQLVQSNPISMDRKVFMRRIAGCTQRLESMILIPAATAASASALCRLTRVSKTAD